jgi:hypothetical protein
MTDAEDSPGGDLSPHDRDEPDTPIGIQQPLPR